MKSIRIEEDLVPIAEFKTHASRLMRRLQADGHPIVITQRGRAAGVLISPADFDRFTERERFVAAVEAGLEDAQAQRVLSDEAVSEHFAARLESIARDET